MRVLKIIAIVGVVYLGLVVAVESSVAYWQPRGPWTMDLTTVDEAGAPHATVVSRLESDGQLYVASNHWARGWYRRALANPSVEVTSEGQTLDYRAVPVSGPELERVERDHPRSLVFGIMTGFAPRYLLRLDPAPLVDG